jgi:DNA-binding NarL/FixJ family response regulator
MVGNPLNILIADDHALIRKALRQLLVDRGLRLGEERLAIDITEVEEFDAVLTALEVRPAHLLLIDLLMPGMAGAVSLRGLRDAQPHTKIIVVTGCEDRATILGCLSAGIHGYVLKTVAPDTITHAIEVVLSGQIYLPPEIAEVPASTGKCEHEIETATPSVATFRFTSRQLDVLRLLGAGQSTKEIARALDVSEGTVKVHLAAIYRLLGARNRMEAVLLASKIAI